MHRYVVVCLVVHKPHGCINDGCAGDTQEPEVTIRRRPPAGKDRQPYVSVLYKGVPEQSLQECLQEQSSMYRCGPVDFKVPTGEDNEPANILEEIIWCVELLLQLFYFCYHPCSTRKHMVNTHGQHTWSTHTLTTGTKTLKWTRCVMQHPYL